ncbi:MAG: hypothetical protein V3V08_15835 [Nannocystaceae bacterium]
MHTVHTVHTVHYLLYGRAAQSCLGLVAVALGCVAPPPPTIPWTGVCEHDLSEAELGGSNDSPIRDVAVTVHASVATILKVSWTQTNESEAVWIEYTFENDNWLHSPERGGLPGSHHELLLGVPGDTDVRFRIVTRKGERRTETARQCRRTGTVPHGMPRPTVAHYDRALASEHRWMFGSVEATRHQDAYRDGPYWLYIIDRAGRIVWYYRDRAYNPEMAFPRLARDGSHLIVEKKQFVGGVLQGRIMRFDLDLERIDRIEVPGMDDCYDITDDGSILFNTRAHSGPRAYLKERGPTGVIRNIWDCSQWADDRQIEHRSRCYTNTVNWNPADDTVLLSMPYLNTIVQVDRVSGELVAEWGDKAIGGWRFSPATWGFGFNHWANLTSDGTLLVSSHMPGFDDRDPPGEHGFLEFELDRTNKILREKWFYKNTRDWPRARGMAQRLANGNTLGNYGTGGTIQEVTPELQLAWDVRWDADFPNSYFNRLVGHNTFLDNLYELTAGP